MDQTWEWKQCTGNSDQTVLNTLYKNTHGETPRPTYFSPFHMFVLQTPPPATTAAKQHTWPEYHFDLFSEWKAGFHIRRAKYTCHFWRHLEIHRHSHTSWQCVSVTNGATHSTNVKGKWVFCTFLDYKLPPGMWLKSSADPFTCQTHHGPNNCRLPHWHLERKGKKRVNLTVYKLHSYYLCYFSLTIQQLAGHTADGFIGQGSLLY